MKKLIIVMILAMPSIANAQIYGQPGGLYPSCQLVTTCTNGQCYTVRVCQ